MKHKKKLIISSYDDIHNPYYGGGGAYAIYEVVSRLKYAYDITVITGTYPGAKNERIDTISYKRIGSTVFGPKLGQFVFQILLPYYLLTQKFDLWIESFTPPFSTAFLQVLTRKPIIGLIHMLSGEDMQRKYKVPFYLIERIGLKTYNHFIVLSEQSKKAVRKYNSHCQIVVIPNGVSLPTKKIILGKKKYVLFMGRIEVDQKGIDLLLEAWKKSNESDIQLAIVGTGIEKEMNTLKEMIRSLHLENRVSLLGKLKGEEKEKILRESLFIVIPSRFETFSVVALEAIAYKLPIVCFDIDGLKWIPSSFAIKVPQIQAHMLAVSIRHLLTNKKARESLVKDNDRFIKDFHWEHVVKKYEDFIISTLHKKSYV